DERSRESDIRIRLAERARRAEMEEARLRLAGRVRLIRPKGVARRPIAVQEVVALRDAERDELLLVARRLAIEPFEAVARDLISSRAEQPLGAAELQLKSIRRQQHRRLEPIQLRPRELSLGGQRELEIQAAIGGDR